VIFPWSGVGYFQSKLHMFEFESFHEDNRVSAIYILLEITEEIFTKIKNGLNLSNTGYIQANDANFLAEAHFTQTSEGFLVSWVRVG